MNVHIHIYVCTQYFVYNRTHPFYQSRLLTPVSRSQYCQGQPDQLLTVC